MHKKEVVANGYSCLAVIVFVIVTTTYFAISAYFQEYEYQTLVSPNQRWIVRLSAKRTGFPDGVALMATVSQNGLQVYREKIVELDMYQDIESLTNDNLIITDVDFRIGEDTTERDSLHYILRFDDFSSKWLYPTFTQRTTIVLEGEEQVSGTK